MNSKTILNVEKPQTQTVDAIKALLSWRGRAADPLPSFIEMGEGDSRLVLVLSNKKDCYYVTTARDCSCPAASWRPGQRCKHQRAHFPEEAATKPVATDIIVHKPFRPFLEDELRPAKAALPSPLVDCLEEPTARDVAYWSIAEDKAMWPQVEA